MNHPPWEVFAYETKMVYNYGDGDTTKYRSCDYVIKKKESCQHDFGDANYGFQTCKKCNYTY